ncbi:hypothetical protein [Leifsonia sp. 21MFCrub1.1]|uniref:hypothetical protein n=1 Tax=Leifsonia sp. 21MFCrub1.1 TaxID=1798223 RepID=UPI000892A28F|nr:hypothetical protein [Leifsonia sp. 21MFCrub1.1]SEA55313.1 hypothetical protein SAMN04515680_0712 [Leifsonia sp. 21MFCrub1.1]
MSAKGELLVVGGEPRVDLLPDEIRALRRGAATRRALALGVVGVLLLTVAGVVGSGLLAASASGQLRTAQNATTDLLAQQGKYVEVRKVQDDITTVEAAQKVGASSEIDWRDYLVKVQQTLPPTVTLQTITIDSASPLVTYVQATAPLQGARVATLTISARSPQLPQVPSWLDALKSLPGFVDAVPGSVTLDEQSAEYTVNITMHIDQRAYSERFGGQEKK